MIHKCVSKKKAKRYHSSHIPLISDIEYINRRSKRPTSETSVYPQSGNYRYPFLILLTSQCNLPIVSADRIVITVTGRPDAITYKSLDIYVKQFVLALKYLIAGSDSSQQHVPFIVDTERNTLCITLFPPSWVPQCPISSPKSCSDI